MGIQAVYRKRSLSTLGAAKYIKPYLLRGLKFDHLNQVWSPHNSLDTSNCIEVLKTAISRYGTPEILNSDQGCQFTSKEWADACAEYPEMKASMDSRSRAKDNIWIERFWKTIKYEYIYNGTDLFFGIKRFIDDYNYHRRHQGTDAASESRINLLILPSSQEEKATGLNQPYNSKQALHSSGSLVLTKNNSVPV